eukprot:gnl/TRDRNA2_/TRDRNA2_164554_c0_seq3.p1 gnl/TRDRNA2_/TRDRNA2_164554_c0~~gnl/TRDRNA2_/TRDRNA2_164554_c0_seq3.p1  ORF type:complete len:242 (+),score=22.54 gnl/TRDRNA2_/TRDRNA2_164554_c0_seq3:181-906(+)
MLKAKVYLLQPRPLKRLLSRAAMLGVGLKEKQVLEAYVGSTSSCTDMWTRRYYFEIRILELVRGEPEAISLGFMWGADVLSSTAKVRNPRQLPCTLIAGGEPPCISFGGRDLGSSALASWRPSVQVMSGSVVGVLLEVQQGGELCGDSDGLQGEIRVPSLQLKIFQDGAVNAKVTVIPRLPDEAWALVPSFAPHGLVDVCGGVRRVSLVENARPPGLPDGGLSRRSCRSSTSAIFSATGAL